MSDEQTTEIPPRRKRSYQRRQPAAPPVAETPVQPLPIQVTPRRNAALARRLSGNPHASPTREIPMKEPGKWQLYIANDYNNADDLYRMVHEKGWEHLREEDIACKPREIGYRVSEDGHLVKGPQGREQVFKMRIEDYNALKMRETEYNNSTIGRPGKAKAAAASAVASAFGDEAGTFVDKHLVGEITDTVEPLPQ